MNILMFIDLKLVEAAFMCVISFLKGNSPLINDAYYLLSCIPNFKTKTMSEILALSEFDGMTL